MSKQQRRGSSRGRACGARQLSVKARLAVAVAVARAGAAGSSNEQAAEKG
jgi:hypothetical protein